MIYLGEYTEREYGEAIGLAIAWTKEKLPKSEYLEIGIFVVEGGLEPNVAGQCVRFGLGFEIEISEEMLRGLEPELCDAVLLQISIHELAHAYAEAYQLSDGHDSHWVSTMMCLGMPPSRCFPMRGCGLDTNRLLMDFRVIQSEFRRIQNIRKD